MPFRLVVLAAVVLSAGCRKPAPVVDAGAPPSAPAAVAPVKPLTALSTLSLFEPVEGQCAWRQLDPVTGDKVDLASFPGSCQGARVGWSPDASKAVIWFDPRHVMSSLYVGPDTSKPGYAEEQVDPKAKPRAYVVLVRRPEVQPVPWPGEGGLEVAELGVDATGAVLALLEEQVPEADREKGRYTSAGREFDLSTVTDGLPVIVHAHRLEGKAWRRSETKLSTTGWDLGVGVGALEASRTLGPKSVELAAARAQGDSADEEALKSLARLTPKDATADDGDWIFLGAGGVRFYAWEVRGEFAYTTGLVVANDRPLPDLGFTDGELVAIRTSGPYVLVTAANVGAHPRLYELPAGKLVFKSDTARAVSFWPSTAKPESHER